jgi:uncharacterized protein YndB with AHSA1/START domain
VTERTFDVPAARLFATLVEPESYPRWLVGAKHIREVVDGWPAVGSHFKHVVGFGPFAIPDRTTVRETTPPHVLELLVRARPLLEAVVRFEVTDVGSSCHLRMTETPVGSYRFLAPIAGPLIRARNERSLQRLQAVVSAAPATV